MADDFEARLEKAARALRAAEIIELRRRDLKERIDEVAEQVAVLQDRLADERGDVERLESLSFARMLTTLLGSRDDRLAREQAEVDAAAFRLRAVEAQLSGLQKEDAMAKLRERELAGAATLYTAALNEKERHLRDAADDPRQPRLLALAEERGRLHGELRELGEAQTAARAAQSALQAVEEHLARADRSAVAGVMSSRPAVNLTELDLAAGAARRADERLVVLRTELREVGSILRVARTPATPLRRLLMEGWLDSGISEHRIAGWIQRSLNNVRQSVQYVEEVYGQLDERASPLQERLEAIEAGRKGLLTGQ